MNLGDLENKPKITLYRPKKGVVHFDTKSASCKKIEILSHLDIRDKGDIFMKLPAFVTQRLGFTMVELLVVISIIGILATAVLAALNPIEQLRKGRDTSRKADAASVLSALDRYQATFGCYPWERVANVCNTSRTPASVTGGTNGFAITSGAFTGTGILAELVTREELKSVFSNRTTVTQSEMWLYEEPTSHQASICFTPESQTARAGGLGLIRTAINGVPTNPATACSGAYAVLTANTDQCSVCVPQ